MIATIPQPVKLWGRGQLTLPKQLREALKLDDRTILNVFVVGDTLILTRKKLLGPSLAEEFQRAMKKQGLTLKDLLKALEEERRRYMREHYGL
jgi:bifunctional DNA-binding transcriptional regulator/antitoxin component of YhaV-PrlF toxin-antitoxin module